MFNISHFAQKGKWGILGRCFVRNGYGSRFAFLPLAKIIVAASLRTGVSNSPPDCCIPMGSTPAPSFLNNKATPDGVALLFGAGYGSRTRLICLGSRDSTDELILRCAAIIAKGNWKFNPYLSKQSHFASVCVMIIGATVGGPRAHTRTT